MAGRLTPAHYGLFDLRAPAWQAVHLFDAHHDSGYPREGGPTTFAQWQEQQTYSCEDWMLLHHERGSALSLTYPAWRPDGEPTAPMVPLHTTVDDGTPVPEAFDAVFLCRSAAWVPSWCDDQFTDFLAAFPGCANLLPGTPWTHPRPDPLPDAHRWHALSRDFTSRLAAGPAPPRRAGPRVGPSASLGLDPPRPGLGPGR